ncbi:MAG TPA: MGMT family protein [Candidatus Nitrosotenuis sp.]|nr:MGMT family protein [Candidatus Nitrosotenuis sp.]
MGIEPDIGPANLKAPPFYRRVYALAAQIPRGRVATYADLARAAGSPGASRAVGTAMRANRDTRCVPCHRVVRSDGRVGSYAGGPQGSRRKMEMLQAEGVDIDLERGRVRHLARWRFLDFVPPGPDPRA